MKSLNGKRVLVTGCANGIGAACALGFQGDGASVFGADVDERGLEEIAASGVKPILADCASNDDMRAMVGAVLEDSGKLDVMLLNAGYGMSKRLEDLRDGQFEHLVSVHLFGAVNALRAAIPAMKAQKSGHVVLVLSRGAEGNTPGNAAYAAAKSGMWALMRTAAAELRDYGVLVNGLIPGMTNTKIWGEPRPELQPPEAVYPAVRQLATLQPTGPSGRVFYLGKEYPMFQRTLRSKDS